MRGLWPGGVSLEMEGGCERRGGYGGCKGGGDVCFGCGDGGGGGEAGEEEGQEDGGDGDHVAGLVGVLGRRAFCFGEIPLGLRMLLVVALLGEPLSAFSQRRFLPYIRH